MNRFIVLCCAVILLLGMVSCAHETMPKYDTGRNEETSGAPLKTEHDEVLICPVQYIRTDGYHEDVSYPQIVLIDTKESLEAYMADNHGKYLLGCRETVPSDSTIGFVTAVERYDEGWFEEYTLVMVVLEEGSGSNRHKVEGITSDGEILIKCIIPEVGTCDMAVWHLMLEVPKDSPVLEKELMVELLHEEGWEPAPVVASYTSRHAGVQVALPGEGWDWEEIPDAGGEEPFGIRFWPEGDKAAAVELCCHPQMIGLCGTGLSTDEWLLNNGKTAFVHCYDNDPWSLVTFEKVPGYYYATRSGDSDAYDEETMEILKSVVLGWGAMEYDKAVALAEGECDVDHDYANAYFDIDTGFWTVCMGKLGQAGGDTEVVINGSGGIESITYGE